MLKAYRAFLLAFAVVFMFSGAVRAFAENQDESRTIDAQGYSSISGGNDMIARDAAIEDAKRKAVEQAVGTLVSADTVVENFQTLSDNVYTKTQGYIKKFDIINESHTPEIYKVSIRATVLLGVVKNDLDAIGLLHVKAEKPRVLFMIAEQNIGQKYFVFWWHGKSEYSGEVTDMSAAEMALKEAFIGKGFNVVDISGSQDSIEISNAYRVADLTNDAARKIGKNLNAEIIVKGKVIAKEGPKNEGSAISVYIADITAQAIRVDTGNVLGAGKGHGVSRNISDVTGGTDAISKAATEMADKLMEQILAKWSTGTTGIIIRVSGISDFKKVAEFKNTLKKRIRGTNAVYQRKVENGSAVFEVDTKSQASAVADEIAQIPGLRVIGTSGQTIDAVIE